MLFGRYAIIFLSLASTCLGGRSFCAREMSLIESLAHKDFQGEKVIPVAVIGAGPAGCAAAIYTARAGLATVVFLGPGDSLTQAHWVDNWPGREKDTGAHIVEDLHKQAVRCGASLVPKTIEKVDFSVWPRLLWTDDGEKISALTVIIATGGTPKTLDIPGIKEYWGKGIRLCAICDAPFDKGKSVAVIGGGDVGVDKALQLSTFAEKVMILEKEGDLTAMMAARNNIKDNAKIGVVCNTELRKILGDGQRVVGLEVWDTVKEKLYEMPVQSVYFAIGFSPNTLFLNKAVALDEEGYIITAGKTQKTSVEGIFAAGNVEDSVYQKGGTAIGRGFQAGFDAIRFLNQQGFNKALSDKLVAHFYKPDTFSYDLPEIKTEEELNKYIELHPRVVLHFYSPSCLMCKSMSSIIEKVASQFLPDIATVKINIEEHAPLAAHYQVSTVPLLLMLNKGQAVAHIAGKKSKEELTQFFSR